jgi:hypothetical protein
MLLSVVCCCGACTCAGPGTGEAAEGHCGTLTPAQVMSAHTPTRYTSCSSVKRATTEKGTNCTQEGSTCHFIQ